MLVLLLFSFLLDTDTLPLLFFDWIFLALESEAQQKLIRKVLNSLKNPTIGLLVAWDEAMRRWKDLSAVVFSRVMDNESEHSSDVLRRDGIEARATPEVNYSFTLHSNIF